MVRLNLDSGYLAALPTALRWPQSQLRKLHSYGLSCIRRNYRGRLPCPPAPEHLDLVVVVISDAKQQHDDAQALVRLVITPAITD